jgi:hypothetical protein
MGSNPICELPACSIQKREIIFIKVLPYFYHKGKTSAEIIAPRLWHVKDYRVEMFIKPVHKVARQSKI